jgi:mono/diheme cytochrome c family protein
MPGGCQPWTAICEMKQAEDELNNVRGRYLAVVRTSSVLELAANAGMADFIASAGRVYFADNCAGCHGKQGEGIAALHGIAPPLSEASGLPRSDVQAIKGKIGDLTKHTFANNKWQDDTISKILAVYVDELKRGRCGPRRANC